MQLKLRHLYEALGLGITWLASYCGCSTRAIQERLKANFPNEKLTELNTVLAFLIANGNLPEGCETVFPDGFLERSRVLQQTFAAPFIDMCQKQRDELERLKIESAKPADVDTSQAVSGPTLEGLTKYVNQQLAKRDKVIAEHANTIGEFVVAIADLEKEVFPD